MENGDPESGPISNPPFPISNRVAMPLLVAGACLWLYAPILAPFLRRLVTLHFPHQAEQFGLDFLAFPLVGWLVWQKRRALAAVERNPSAWGLGLGGLGVGGFVLGQRMGETFAAQMSLPLTVWGLLFTLFGFPFARTLLIPVLFLAGAFPLPISLAGTIAFPLQKIVAGLAAVICGTVGCPVLREGINLYVAGQRIQVADVCSGLKSFTALLWLLLLLVYLQRHVSWRWKVGCFLALLPISLAANALRVVLIVLLAKCFGPGFLSTWLHEALGLLVFAAVLGVCFLYISSRPGGPLGMESPPGDSPSSSPPPTSVLSPPSHGQRAKSQGQRVGLTQGGALVLLLLGIGTTRGLREDQPLPLVRLDAETIPYQLGGWTGRDLGPPTPEVVPRRLPQEGEYLFREYRAGGRGQRAEGRSQKAQGPDSVRPAPGSALFGARGTKPGGKEEPIGSGDSQAWQVYYVRSNRGRDAFIDIESISLNQGYTFVGMEDREWRMENREWKIENGKSKVKNGGSESEGSDSESNFQFPISNPRSLKVRRAILERAGRQRVYVYSYFGPKRSAVTRIGYKSWIALERGWLGHNPTWSLLWVIGPEQGRVDEATWQAGEDLFRKAAWAVMLRGEDQKTP